MSMLPWAFEIALCWHALIMQRSTSHTRSDPSSKENIFGMPFKERKLPSPHQYSERKKKDIGLFVIMIGEVDVGKRQGWLFWTKRLWRWSNLLFSGVFCDGNYAHFVGNNPVLICLPCATKVWSCTIWSLRKGEHIWRAFQATENSCTKPEFGSKEGPILFLGHNYRRSLAFKKARVDFLSKVPNGLGCFQKFDDTVEPGIFQYIVLFVKWCFRPGLKKYLCAACPWHGKEGILLPHQASPKRRSSLECLPWDGKPMQGSSTQRARGNVFVDLLQCVGEF